MLKYRCLVLDHDDTVVKSTPTIHFPAFKKTLEKLRPNVNMTLEEFLLYSFEPGFSPLCHDILKFTDEEMEFQYNTWNEHVQKTIPKFYEGFEDIIKKQKDEGGLVCVVSHSNSVNILRDFNENFGIEPDMIFGWELGEEKRKPRPYPLNEIMRVYNLKPNELLMVDDLKPGYDMARSCGVDFAYAGWSNQIPKIVEFMKKNCDYYFDSVKKLEKFLFN